MEKPFVIWKRNKTILIDNFFSPVECKEWIDHAEQQGLRSVVYKPSLRANTRVIFYDEQLAANLWTRVRSFVPSTIYLEDTKETWHAKAVNSRFRICRYTEGQFFGKHLDEQIVSKELKSYYTMMIYLTSVEEGKGGETRFYKNDLEETLDFVVQPQQGQLILLWQKGSLHDGAPLHQGVKYILRTEVLFRLNKRLRRI